MRRDGFCWRVRAAARRHEPPRRALIGRTAEIRASQRRLNYLDAQLYALTHRGNPGDVEHYERICRGAAHVLELGSGSGRLLCALAQPKRTLCGLELDPGLLRLGREAVSELPNRKRAQLELVRGDMRSFELGRRFERVLLPYNGLYCLLTPKDVERCLRAVHGALVPGGLFAFDVWNADGVAAEGLDPSLEDEEVASFEHASRQWRVFERCRRGRGSQRLDVTYTYVPNGRGAARTQLLQQRYLRSTELFGLLEKCGFRVASKLGSFEGARFSARAQRLVITARALD